MMDYESSASWLEAELPDWAESAEQSHKGKLIPGNLLNQGLVAKTALPIGASKETPYLAGNN